jgi:hypothetical protein
MDAMERTLADHCLLACYSQPVTRARAGVSRTSFAPETWTNVAKNLGKSTSACFVLPLITARLEVSDHSERPIFFSVLNRRTEHESSECALKAMGSMRDLDSAIRRFDPSRPSQPVDRPKIMVNFCAKSLQFAGHLDREIDGRS